MRHFEVSTETRLGPGEQLFSFLAACIETFLAEEVAAQEQGQVVLQKSSIRRFVITEKAPTRAFSWLKAG